MIAVLQRASRGEVRVDGQTIGAINNGLIIFLGVVQGDEETQADFLAEKISQFRIFNDNNGKMNLSIKDVNGSALVISQFTLCADWLKGRRPSFVKAAVPEKGEQLYEYFIKRLKASDIPVETGKFGAAMEVELINDGPVTFVLDSEQKRKS